jgi:hypothetical protein
MRLTLSLSPSGIPGRLSASPKHMLKTVTMAIAPLLLAILLSFATSAQINYVKTFPNPTLDWTGVVQNGMGCGGAAYMQQLNNATGQVTSPAIPNSNGKIVQFGYQYKVTMSGPGGPVNAAPATFGTIKIQWATSTSGPWTTIRTIGDGYYPHTPSGGCKKDTVYFTPPAGGNIYVRFENTAAGTTSYYFFYQSVSLIQADACSSDSTINLSGCDSVFYNGNYYKTTTALHETYTNAASCDSFVTVNIDILGSIDSVTLTETACDSFEYNNVVYKQSGTYTHIFPHSDAANQCDSVVTLDLTLYRTLDTTITVIACNSFQLGDSVYTQSTSYTAYYLNMGGCDSIITLDLTINTTPPEAEITQSGNVLTANAADSYQWVDCDNGDAPIAGATSQSYTAGPGRYAVVITTDACSDTSDCVTVTNDAVADPGRLSPTKVYPNPTTGTVVIASDRSLDAATIRIMQVTGQMIETPVQRLGNHIMVDLSPYAPGIYFVEIISPAATERVRLIKE